jgi:hypothetical protein
MINALDEFLEDLGGKKVVAANITFGGYNEFNRDVLLPIGYSKLVYDHFLYALKTFTYDNGYGSQHLFGIVWLENGEWMERVEYDGSEYWTIKSYPEIPFFLLGGE